MSEKELSTVIDEIANIKFPPGLHGKIMKQLVFLKFRTPFVVVILLLSINLIFTGMRVWTKLSEAEFLTLMNIVWENFELTGDFFIQFISILRETVPFLEVLVFLTNALLLAYVLHLPLTFKRLVKTA